MIIEQSILIKVRYKFVKDENDNPDDSEHNENHNDIKRKTPNRISIPKIPIKVPTILPNKRPIKDPISPYKKEPRLQRCY